MSVTKDSQLRYGNSGKLCLKIQLLLLKKVFDMLDLYMQKTVQLGKGFFTTRKELTKQENKLTLQRKNTETRGLGI